MMSTGRILKLFISTWVFGFDRARDRWHQMRGNAPTKSTTVLLYHKVSIDQVRHFDRQMRTLLQLARPVRADIITLAKTTQHQVMVTFDDGYRCTIENILPIMRELKIPFTLFIPSRFLGKVPEWTHKNQKYRFCEQIIGKDEIAQLNRYELITFGSHSATHPDFLHLNSEQMWQELVQSKQELEAILTKPVQVFSFPYGNFAPWALPLLKQSGFRRMFTTHFRVDHQEAEDFMVDRVQVEPSDWILEFKLKALGCYRWQAKASHLKTWLLRLMFLPLLLCKIINTIFL